MGIEVTGMEEFLENLDRTLKEFPQDRRQLHQEMGKMMEGELHSRMDTSFDRNEGNVKGWQEKYVGSGGGYAAVRAQKGSTSANGRGKAYAYGYITNAVESGHKTRQPEGRSKRKYKARVRVPKVQGRHFYQSAKNPAHENARRMIEEFVEKLAAKLEGKA